MKTLEQNKYENIDFLTNLYNRKYFLEYVNFLIKNNIEFAIFVIDLNRFKLINDVHGHDIGDIVLIEVGKRFKSLEKEGLLFSRFGGDEFAAVYQTTEAEKINQFGEEIKNVLTEHIVISESEFTISASIGVSRFPRDSKDISDLLKLADMAMYQSKKSENDSNFLISDELNEKLAERRKIEQLLRSINIDEDLFLEYQPIFDLKSLNLIGMEALVRWKHKTEGVIYPDDFIQVAEELDIIKDVTRWVFINGLHQIKAWNEKYNKNLKMSLNVSDICIHNKIFFGNLQFMLDHFEVNPAWLSIELSERSLLVSPQYMKKLLVSINELGVDTFIHNFGSSPFMIADLNSLKIKAIKIARKYVSNLDSFDGMSIVNSMILLAHGLGLNIYAEGIETEEQYQILKHYNCQRFQGFYKEHPLSKEAFEQKYLIPQSDEDF